MDTFRSRQLAVRRTQDQGGVEAAAFRLREPEKADRRGGLRNPGFVVSSLLLENFQELRKGESPAPEIQSGKEIQQTVPGLGGSELRCG